MSSCSSPRLARIVTGWRRVALEPGRRVVLLFAAGVIVFGAVAAPAVRAQTSPHPFYDRLLLEGSRALHAGDHQEAARRLRLAAFGLLQDPPALATALVQLALAQVALNDEAGATESISRTLDVERRFGAYEAAASALTLDVRREFEEILVQRFTEPQLRDLGSLSRLADVRLERDLAALGAAERRAKLEELAAAQPNEVRWSSQLAQLALDAGELEAAIAHATRLLEAQPSDTQASCIRGIAHAESGQCENAVEDLARCPSALEVERFAIGRVDCLARVGRLDEASAVLAALPPALLAQRSFRRLERSIADQVEAARRQAVAEERRQAQAAAAAAREAERQAQLQAAAERAAAAASSGDDAAAPPTDQAAAPETTPPAPSRAETPARGRGNRQPAATEPATGQAATNPPPPETAPRDPAREPAGRRNRPVVVEPGMPAAAEATASQIRRMATNARSANDFVEPLQLARDLADRYPQSRDAQHLAAEVAYRASRWAEAVAYFGRGGPPAAERPELSFYEAVSRYETGDLAGARAALDRALPQIQRTPFVERYVSRIQGGAPGAEG